MNEKKEQRQAAIFDLVLNEGKIKVKDLASALSVSPETIRLDLTEMERQKKITREHGYACSISYLDEIPLQMRARENIKEKRRVAIRALQEVKPNQTVYLDAGTTLILGLPALPRNQNITIVTTSLPIAYEAGLMGFSLHVLGGAVGNMGLRVHGVLCSEMIMEEDIDVAILGSDGLQDTIGFTTTAFNEIGIKQTVMHRAKKTIVVADHSKFETRAPFNIERFEEIDLLITNHLTAKEKKMIQGVKKIIEV